MPLLGIARCCSAVAPRPWPLHNNAVSVCECCWVVAMHDPFNSVLRARARSPNAHQYKGRCSSQRTISTASQTLNNSYGCHNRIHIHIYIYGLFSACSLITLLKTAARPITFNFCSHSGAAANPASHMQILNMSIYSHIWHRAPHTILK